MKDCERTLIWRTVVIYIYHNGLFVFLGGRRDCDYAITIDQSEILSRSQLQFITLLFWRCTTVLRPSASHGKLLEFGAEKPISGAKPTHFDFSAIICFYWLESHTEHSWRCSKYTMNCLRGSFLPVPKHMWLLFPNICDVKVVTKSCYRIVRVICCEIIF